jgi:CDP-glycerol glycerophosphotransferase (TagB/SpsB family)
MPTWRDAGYDIISSAGLNFKKIDYKLKKNNSLLILKFHINTKHNSLNNIKDLSNIIIYDDNIDLYSFLPFTDILITDYSSIYYDYLLLNKQTILYVFDIDRYISNSREFNYDFSKYTGCHKAYNFIEFIEILEIILSDKKKPDNKFCQEKTKNLISTFWGSYKGDASKKLFNFITKEKQI